MRVADLDHVALQSAHVFHCLALDQVADCLRRTDCIDLRDDAAKLFLSSLIVYAVVQWCHYNAASTTKTDTVIDAEVR